MRICNVCNKAKSSFYFKHAGKKTCSVCEFRFRTSFLRFLVKDKKLTPKERLSNRLGYMGSSFIMLSPYLLKYDNIKEIEFFDDSDNNIVDVKAVKNETSENGTIEKFDIYKVSEGIPKLEN